MLDPGLGLPIVEARTLITLPKAGFRRKRSTRERPDERHVRLGRDRLSSVRRRGPHFANQGEDLVVLDQMVGNFDRPLGS